MLFAGKLTLNSGSKTVMELGKYGGALNNDFISALGTMVLNGTLTVTNISTNALAAGDSFNLFDANTLTGNFTSKTLPALATNLVWDTSQLANGGIITVVSVPIITNQPQSLFVNPGRPASFSVGAAGTGTLAYQWCKNGASLPGATANPFTIPGVSTGDSANYTVIVTNSYGSVTSAVAVLTVNLPPVVTGVGMLANGGFSLSVTGAPGETCVLLGASNLVPPMVWLPLVTNTADTNGVFIFSDSQATNFPQRFYQIVSP